jgi:alpha-D-xyloside xylohydrolase
MDTDPSIWDQERAYYHFVYQDGKSRRPNVKLFLEGAEENLGFETRNFEYLTRIVSVKSQGSEVGLECETSLKRLLNLRIDVYSEDVIRFRLSNSGEIADQRTEMLVVDKIKAVPFELKDGEECVSIATGELAIRAYKDPCSLEILDSKGHVLRKQITTKNYWGYSRTQTDFDEVRLGFPAFPIGFIKRSDVEDLSVYEFDWLFPDEHIYGLGEKFGEFDKRGQKVTIWNTNPWANENQKAYKNIPFYLSTRGYGLFVNSSSLIHFQFGNSNTVSQTIEVKDHQLDYFFIYGPSFKKILCKYSELTGKAPVPPKWSFGLWSGMVGIREDSSEETVSRCREFRKYDIPIDVMCSGFWNEWGRYLDFEWSKKKFPNPKKMIEELGKMGIKYCLYLHSYITKGTKAYNECVKGGFFVKKKEDSVYDIKATYGIPYVGVVDFSNPDAVKWYKDKLKEKIGLGVKSFWPDYGDAAPSDGIYFNMLSGRLNHNLYSLLYIRTVYEALQEEAGEAVLWSRPGFAGIQRYPIQWSGDPACNFPTLACVLRAGLGYGLSGVPFWSNDLGGYSGKPSLELYLRWCQFGLLCSHSRIYGDTRREPWIFGENALKIFRRYVKLRYRLLPYIYSCANLASQTGLPVIRAMILEFQEDPNCYDKDQQYMLGPSLLIAPVLNGNGKVSVYIPKGSWRDYWSKEEFKGPMTLDRILPLDVLPIYVRSDSIIPMAPEMEYVGQKPWDPLTVEIYCRSKSHFTLFDDKETIDFKCARAAHSLTLKIKGPRRSYILKFNGTEPPSRVLAGRRSLKRVSNHFFEHVEEGWLHGNGTVTIKISAKGRQTVKIIF